MPLRIGLIAPPWIPVPAPVYGGTEVVVDELARGFAAAGHDVTLFCTGDSGCPVHKEWLYEEGQWSRMGDPEVESRHADAAYEALAGCDIVHDHTVLGPSRAGRYPDLAVVATCHGPLGAEVAEWYASLSGRVAIVAISESQRAQAPQLPVAKVIPHGVDTSVFPVGRGDGGYVAFLGRMSPDKGPHRAIAAARAAGVHLVLAGKIWSAAERRFFESDVRPLLGPDAVFIGELDRKAKLRLLGSAAGLLNPIRWREPFGLVMIEAMACGTPVLSFPEGAAPEIIEDGRTGFLCADEFAMSAAISRIGELDRAACRAEVEARFSAAHMVNEHLALYRQIIDRPLSWTTEHTGPGPAPRSRSGDQTTAAGLPPGAVHAV